MYLHIHFFHFYISTKKERVFNPLCKVSLCDYSLSVSLTTVAECTVSFLTLYATSIIINTTIFGEVDLSIVKGSSFVDLLTNEIECVHEFTPEVVGILLRSFSRLRPSSEYILVLILLQSQLTLP